MLLTAFPQLDAEVGYLGVDHFQHRVHQRAEGGACRQLGKRGEDTRRRAVSGLLWDLFGFIIVEPEWCSFALVNRPRQT